ncbi:MAG: tetratricopeptide repeat protein [Bacteroidota bacterium]
MKAKKHEVSRNETAEIHFELGLELARDGHDGEAAAEFRQVVELEPGDAVAWNNLGLALACSDDLDGAIQAYQQAISLRREYVKAHNNLGVAYMKKGQVDWALAHFKQALQLDPTYPEAQTNFQHAMLHKGRFELDESAARRLRNDFGVERFNALKKAKPGFFGRFRKKR